MFNCDNKSILIWDSGRIFRRLVTAKECTECMHACLRKRVKMMIVTRGMICTRITEEQAFFLFYKYLDID